MKTPLVPTGLLSTELLRTFLELEPAGPDLNYNVVRMQQESAVTVDPRSMKPYAVC